MSGPNINSLIAGLQKDDPKLYEALKAIATDLAKINATLYPFIAAAQAAVIGVPVSPPLTFTYEILPRALQFSWPSVEFANVYEIREGTVWETAEFVLRTVSLSAAINPISSGTHNYLLKSINANGTYSIDSIALMVVIASPSVVDITAQVIDNNVLLRWTNAVTAFQLDYYIITKNGVEIGRNNGTFSSVFESVGGEYSYGVQAVDVAGNVGGGRFITVTVAQPPDFVLEDTLNADLSAPDDSDNVHVDGEMLVVCTVNGRTWQQHFEDNTWTTIQDQISAGYPFYAEPAETDGYAEYIFDFGAIFTNVIITTEWLEQVVDGDIAVAVEISYSDDDITYTTPAAGTTLFAPSLRYAKIRLIFTPDDDASLSNILYLKASINVKREMDGGTVDVLAADTTGTVVDFNKAFKDVETITLTPLSTVEQVAIFDFVDTPYPTDFKILLFDNAGVRVDGTVSWKARGII